MDENRVYNKLDKIEERLGSIDVTLIEQHISLREHIKRTNLLEKKLEPVEKHVIMVQGGLKFVGIIATLTAIAEAIYMVFK